MLQKIVAAKKIEVAERKMLYPVGLLERSINFDTPVVSLKKYIKRPDKSGIIAEIKRQSPSKGIINKYVSVEKTSIGYMQAGASALSVLTDNLFFGGDNNDLKIARKYNYCPVLRKEFIVDEYQIIEARSLGADAILLIASILSKKEVASFTALAHSLKMEVLFEVHSKDEILNLDVDVDIIGVNNRDLNSFQTNTENSLALIKSIPTGVVKISESGISDPQTAFMLRKEGFDGFLIGEQFMRHSRPEEACASFIRQLNALA